jgi:stage II sporulation protein AA (anti-sigma F factor antagonist)
MSLQVSCEQVADVLVVRLKGELDHHTAPIMKETLEAELAKGRVRHALLNFRELTFMDSSGIGVILGRYKQVLQRNGKMAVCEMNPTIRRIMEMSGMFKVLVAETTEQSALSRLEGLAK